MVKNGKRTTMPKLRFPKFRTRLDWGSIRLGDASTPVTERVGERKLTPISISAGVGFVPQAEKFGRDISGNQYSRYTLVRDGDFVYNKGNSLKFPQGCVYQLRGWGEVAAPNVFISFRLKQDFVAEYFQYCFEKNIHGVQLKQHITSGARSNGLLNVSKDQFYGIGIPMPLPDEQQKIANCLSSLDELIAAQVRKVEALKRYKRGLMQQLFPHAGETVPRLRFPEFRNAPEWDVQPLCKIAENLDNKRVPITESERTKGSVPYYGASGVVDYVKDYLFDEELLCVSEDGANLIARTYPIAFPITGKTWVNNHAHVLRFKNSATQKIVQDYLNSVDLQDFITGMAQPKLNRAMLDRIPVPLPDVEEGKKLAGFLFATDSYLAGVSGVLDSLITHKNGLIQQLFPSQEEA